MTSTTSTVSWSSAEAMPRALGHTPLSPPSPEGSASSQSLAGEAGPDQLASRLAGWSG